MYITGQSNLFASRMHQGATDQTSLDSFINEGNGVWNSLAFDIQTRYEREARLAKYRFTKVAADLSTALFNQNIPFTFSSANIGPIPASNEWDFSWDNGSNGATTPLAVLSPILSTAKAYTFSSLVNNNSSNGMMSITLYGANGNTIVDNNLAVVSFVGGETNVPLTVVGYTPSQAGLTFNISISPDDQGQTLAGTIIIQ